MISTPRTPAEYIREHARVRVLLLLREVLSRQQSEGQVLRSLRADAIDRACLAPSFRVWIADLAAAGVIPDIASVMRMIESARLVFDGQHVLPLSDTLRRVAGPSVGDRLIDDETVVSAAWSTARSVLSELQLQRLCGIVQAIDLVAGVQGPYGEIRCSSNILFPGFAAIGVNNPPIILAEQAIHEAVHVVFAAMLALDGSLCPLADDRVGVLSPFTDSARTVERVAHGILSYTAVREVWRAVGRTAAPETLTGVASRDEAIAIVRRRVQNLDARLALAMTLFGDAAGPVAVETLVRLGSTLLGVETAAPTALSGQRRAAVVAAGYPADPSALNAIQQAELWFAERGDKVSRITVPVGQLASDGFAIAARVGVCVSAWSMTALPDERLGGFSNIAAKEFPLLAAREDHEVHLYLHRDPELAREAAILDRDDLAGGLLGIPACCREWFSREWPSARVQGGDLFAVMVRQNAKDGITTMASECDASAMYRGGGLCWHFPCSPFCAETIRAVRTRRCLMASAAPGLLEELDAAGRRSLTVLADGSYGPGAEAGEGAVAVVFE